MGTLTDITAKANNAVKRQSDSSMALQALNLDNDENFDKGKSPYFMSPTLSSKKQLAVKLSKSPEHNLAPLSTTVHKPTSSNWMASAAKRVGFAHVGDGIPRSRKEGQAWKAITFPDKVSASWFKSYIPRMMH